ncbi:c-type cytochrome [Polaribacter glomeratus]|uniref:c-type cytochrome n=1 Tax=Polaribacter glomeratus TaxID=102 RepID=UPI000CF53E44|nr:cytochrome c [Polaribacter glomeratus]TXD64136.1 cytochrome c [Polaribacter glomeratus]
MKTLLIFTAALFFYFSIESEAKIEIYTSQDPLKESIKRGSEIYSDFCMSCHLPAGEGVAEVFPPLAKSDYLMQKRKESIQAIKYGLKGKIIVNGQEYNGNMSALGLADDEVADVMNYITNSWGNENDKMVTEEEVAKIEK